MSKVVIVTKDSLQGMLNSTDRTYVTKVVGRALVRIYERQTAAEQNASVTVEANGIGFTGADGRYGSWCAKFYAEKGYLANATLEKWTRRGNNGYSRIAKYHKQLNEIAIERQDAVWNKIKGV